MPRPYLPLAMAATALALAAPPALASAEPSPRYAPDQAADRTFEATGVIRVIPRDRSYVVIAHDEIPGLMQAMTMPFDLRSPSLLDGLSRGDPVRFTLTATDGGRYIIERIQRR